MIDLSKSQISYLTSVFELNKTGCATITKIAEYLEISKPSVVKGLKKLEGLNLITYDSKIKLTHLGLLNVNNIIRRNLIIQKFLTDILGINEVLAKKDAEAMKSEVSCYTIGRLEKFLEQVLNEEYHHSEYCLETCDSCKKSI